MFFDLVRRNSKRSRKENGIFFVSLITAIVAFYMILSLGQQDVMRFLRVMESDAVNRLLGMIPVLYGFSLFIIFFLIYFACKYQLERRSHELGMYLMMGMSRGRLASMLILEDLWSSVLALLVGVPVSAFLSELVSLITAKLVGLGIIGHQPSFSIRALIFTIAGFLAVKFVAFAILSGKIASRDIGIFLADTQEEKQQEIKKSTSVYCLAFGILFLAGAYILAMIGAAWISFLVMAGCVLLGTAGTFLIFWGLRSGIEVVIRKKGKEKGLGIFTFRQLQENIVCRPNSIAVSSLLILAALCCFGYGISVGVSAKNQEQHVLDYTFQGEESEIRSVLSEPELKDSIDQLFEVRLKTFYTEEGEHSISWDGLLHEIEDQGHSEDVRILVNNISQMWSPHFISLSGYNRIREAAGEEPLILADGQVALYSDPEFSGGDKERLMQAALEEQPELLIDGRTYTFAPELCNLSLVVDRAITISYGVIIPDEMFENIFGEDYSSYWDATLRSENVKNAGLMQAISKVNEILDETGLQYESYLQNIGRQLFYAVAASYTTIYLAIIFLIIANTVLAVQFLMQQQKTGKRYRTLIHLGSNYKMLCRSARAQIRWYFGLPVGLALISSVFGVKSLFTGMLPPGFQEQARILFGAAVAIIFVLCVVECIYIYSVMRLSDRHILELMQSRREE